MARTPRENTGSSEGPRRVPHDAVPGIAGQRPGGDAASARRQAERQERRRRNRPFADRLRQVIKLAGGNDRFADLCGVDLQSVNDWLRARNLPQADKLSAIAAKTGVTIDWLLDGVDAWGEPTATPAFRRQGRSPHELQEDLAASVTRAVEMRLGRTLPHYVSVNKTQLFDEIVDIAQREAREWLDYYKRAFTDAFITQFASEAGLVPKGTSDATRGAKQAVSRAIAFKGFAPPPPKTRIIAGRSLSPAVRDRHPPRR